jgi:hypothetical protein
MALDSLVQSWPQGHHRAATDPPSPWTIVTLAQAAEDSYAGGEAPRKEVLTARRGFQTETDLSVKNRPGTGVSWGPGSRVLKWTLTQP